ncbi:MAG: energy-coupling factor ABC transporter permease [Patescibacteria group bacterium]|nr:energy-coupling factor ABC transporter permease [Patescibacteria group bacterium]
MHLPDGILSTPVMVSLDAVSIGVIGYSIKRVNKSITEKQLPLMGVTAAFIFAAQIINIPTIGFSYHLLGSVLAAILLGPWNSAIIMTVVLVVQALIFHDGGITALGANIFNMAVIGAIVCYPLYYIPNKINDRWGKFTGIILASWASILLSGLAAGSELVFSGRFSARVIIPSILIVFSLVGIAEAFITSVAISAIQTARKDILEIGRAR